LVSRYLINSIHRGCLCGAFVSEKASASKKNSQQDFQQPPKQPLDQNDEDHLSGGPYNLLILMVFMAPEVGLEPTTLRLTAECSAIELLRNVGAAWIRRRRTTVYL
jgi:hypothetical protein